MALTTIKVTPELRERISADAKRREQSIGQFLGHVLDDWERQERMAALARSLQAAPPDSDYWEEFSAFDAVGGGLSDG